MSATVDIGEVPPLNAQQISAVVEEALAANFFERAADGSLPTGSALEEAAVELVRQARLSWAAGNRMDGVKSILFVAECDMNPPSSKGATPQMSSATEDLSQQPDDLLKKMEQTLLNYPPSDEVAANLQMLHAEMAKRGLEVSGNGSAPTPETPAPAETVDRKSLEDRLTFSMMRNHGIDPSEVSGLSSEALKWIVEHPGGENQESQPATEEPPVEAQGETIQTTRMVVPDPQEQQQVAPTPAPPAPVTSEREELEGQVSGPALKLYGIGRKDIPDLTDNQLKFFIHDAEGKIATAYGLKGKLKGIGPNELQFMISNPDGRVTKEQLAEAQLKDKGEMTMVAEMTVEQPTIAQQDGAEEAPAGDAFAPPAEETSAEVPPTPAPQNAPEEVPPVAQSSAPPAESGGRVTKKGALLKDLPENPAQEVIDKEHFPIPADIEDAPRLPFDLSKCSDEEVFSFHSRFHACHTRANYVVGLWESSLRDEQRLRKGREVQVANSAPTKDPDDARKRLTDAQREAFVQADPEVISHREREHEVEKVLRQLKVLQDNYSSDVSVCSRQLARRADEAQGAS